MIAHSRVLLSLCPNSESNFEQRVLQRSGKLGSGSVVICSRRGQDRNRTLAEAKHRTCPILLHPQGFALSPYLLE